MIDESAITFMAAQKTPGMSVGNEQTELKKASQEFESVFIGQLFKVMRETIEESEEEGSGLGKGIYTDLFDQRVAISMAERGALGIGDMIYKTLSERESDAASPSA